MTLPVKLCARYHAEPADVLCRILRLPDVPLTLKLDDDMVCVVPAVKLIVDGGVVIVIALNVFEPVMICTPVPPVNVRL